MGIRYSTVQAVRDASGVDSTLKSDAELTRIIEEVEFRLESHFDTKFTPTIDIAQLDGSGMNRIQLPENPVLQIRQCTSNEQTVYPSGIDISEGSGYVYLNTSASLAIFPRRRRNTFIEYVYGWLEEAIDSNNAPYGKVQTKLNGAVTLSSNGGDENKSVTVDSTSSFTANDFVRIWGIDGKRETTRIVSVDDATTLTLEYVSQAHADDSYVTKVDAPEWFKELVGIVAGIKTVGNIVGSQYDEITGYEIGEMRIQKGEPYTQWRETIIRLVNQRDEILAKHKPRPGVA